MSDDACTICTQKIDVYVTFEIVGDGRAHRRCLSDLPCRACHLKLGTGPIGRLDQYTAPFEVPADLLNWPLHSACALKVAHRETKRAQIEMTAAAIVKACQASPLRELLAEVGETLRALRNRR